MTEETQDFVYTTSWLAEKLKGDRRQAELEAQQQREEDEEERLRAAYLEAGGTEAGFKREYTRLREEARRGEAIAIERTNRQVASRSMRNLF
jgi:hypothetical protein